MENAGEADTEELRSKLDVLLWANFPGTDNVREERPECDVGRDGASREEEITLYLNFSTKEFDETDEWVGRKD